MQSPQPGLRAKKQEGDEWTGTVRMYLNPRPAVVLVGIVKIFFGPDVDLTFWTGLVGLRQALRRRRLEEGVIQELLSRPALGVVQAETPARKMKCHHQGCMH